MNIFGVGTAELVVILIIALLVLGPERLPEIARMWAKFTRTMSTFTRTWQDFNTQLTAEINREVEGGAKPAAKPSAQPKATPAQPAQPVVAADGDANTIAPPELQAEASQPAGATQADEIIRATEASQPDGEAQAAAAASEAGDTTEAPLADAGPAAELPPDEATDLTAADPKHE